MDDEDVIRQLPVRFKKPPAEEGVTLKVVDPFVSGKCDHRSGHIAYLLREGEAEIECSHCGTKLDPMWVLRRLAHEEMGWHRVRKLYIDEMRRLSEREKTKCRNCGQMTRISRR